jgi:hypothetical protein
VIVIVQCTKMTISANNLSIVGIEFLPFFTYLC